MKVFPSKNEWKKIGITPNVDIATKELYGTVRNTPSAIL